MRVRSCVPLTPCSMEAHKLIRCTATDWRLRRSGLVALRRGEPGVAGQGTLPLLERAVKRPASWSGKHVCVDRACLFGYQRAAAEAPNFAHQATVMGLRRQEPSREAGNDQLLKGWAVKHASLWIS